MMIYVKNLACSTYFRRTVEVCKYRTINHFVITEEELIRDLFIDIIFV